MAYKDHQKILEFLGVHHCSIQVKLIEFEAHSHHLQLSSTAMSSSNCSLSALVSAL